MTENANRDGSVKVSNDIFYKIASIAAREVEGVYDLASVKDSHKKETNSAIEIDISGQEIRVDIDVILLEGIRIADVAKNVQKNVKKQIEVMTGLKVPVVNVTVVDIVEKEEDDS